MKKILFLLAFLPFISEAQQWQVGAGAGVSAISVPDGLPLYNNSKLKPNIALMLTVARHISPKIEVGMGVCVMNLSRIADVVVTSYGVPVGTAGDARVQLGTTAVLIMPSLSYTVHHFYFGPQLGVVISGNGTDNYYSGDHAHVYYNINPSYCAGLHAGFVKNLTKLLALNAEASVNYVHGTEKLYTERFNIVQSQLILGLRYSFRAALHENRQPG